MRIVVTGATGNVGTSVVDALVADPRVTEIVGLARRRPRLVRPRTTWVQADVARSPLTELLRGADAVIHLAWLIQPSRDEATTYAVNVTGSRRVFEAVAEAGVPALVYASSVGAYSPGPKDRAVDESWPTDGTPTSFYARHKAAAERELDAVAAAHPELRVVRLRPGLIFKREAASGIRRLFAGPFLPFAARATRRCFRSCRSRPGLRVQARPRRRRRRRLPARGDRRAARAAPTTSPPSRCSTPGTLGRALGARPDRAAGPARCAPPPTSPWRLRLQPSEPGWLDLGMAVPIMDSEPDPPRARLGAGARRRRGAARAARGDPATAPARPRRRSTRAPAGRCGCVSC